MDDVSENKGRAAWTALLRVLRPAAPAVIGAAALTFLFAAVMPLDWIAGISWNLYLDRLSDLFLQPIGNGGRLALALAMASIAALVAGIIALMIAQPEASGVASLRRRMRRKSEADEEEVLPRRRVDLHPDDPPRPPIRAGRDLPAEGLGPLTAYDAARAADEDAGSDLSFAEPAWGDTAPVEGAVDDEDELVLAELAPEPAVSESTGDEPWLQPAELAAPVMPDPADKSLGAMVARLEAGLARRRDARAEPATAFAAAAPGAAAMEEDVEPEVDFALEAALSTLQRMTSRAVG
ncbi:hypothetical protein FHR22_004021 [Sphingopyxis panaciterrae]|uniref:hypothetical protein n=1 Tax=Sphingopyxis panaciterrae TaxID=363841 RepID=UPI001421DCE8|nr:hypothetical protein [Sphingopyxis panaciterrae]NIJ39274.1 hypothetical protein [Sphingopyxis panaciterrae]